MLLVLESWKVYPGRLVRVAVGPYGVWGVSNGHSIYKKTPTGWENVGGSLVDISVGRNSVWGVNGGDNIYMRSGSGGWQHISGKLVQVLSTKCQV